MDNVRICTGLVTQKEYCIIMFYQMWVYLYLQASKSFFFIIKISIINTTSNNDNQNADDENYANPD